MSGLKPIGFVGLGIMGKGMLRNLLTKIDSSVPFVIWNRCDSPSFCSRNCFIAFNRSPEACDEIRSQFPERVSVVQCVITDGSSF